MAGLLALPGRCRNQNFGHRGQVPGEVYWLWDAGFRQLERSRMQHCFIPMLDATDDLQASFFDSLSQGLNDEGEVLLI